jgi:hypothetical protein
MTTGAEFFDLNVVVSFLWELSNACLQWLAGKYVGIHKAAPQRGPKL